MTQEMILDIVREGLFTILITVAPPLILGLVVGLGMSIFQTVTSIQEQTLAFIPKIIAVLLGLLIFGPFMIDKLSAYISYLVTNLPDFISPR
jgi:flagellar biosynthetic protein FliQ